MLGCCVWGPVRDGSPAFSSGGVTSHRVAGMKEGGVNEAPAGMHALPAEEGASHRTLRVAPALGSRTAVTLTPAERICVQHRKDSLTLRFLYHAHNNPLNDMPLLPPFQNGADFQLWPTQLPQSLNVNCLGTGNSGRCHLVSSL